MKYKFQDTMNERPSSEKRGGVLHPSDETASKTASDFSKRIRMFLRSRYVLMIICVLVAGSLIFIQTASLQLTTRPITVAGNEMGISRQMTVLAPRGVIMDRYGTPLAYNVETRVLYLAYAGLDSPKLNAMLTDLTAFLEERGIAYDDSLSEFLAVSPVRFTADMADVVYWQKNILGLKEPVKNVTVTFDDEYVKTDPAMLFRYLSEKRFGIGNPSTSDTAGPVRNVSINETTAFRVMRLRYLVLADEWAFRNGTPLLIAEGLDVDTTYQLEEQSFRFMGLVTGSEYRRAYSPAVTGLAHVMGYVGAVSASEYESLKTLGYAPDAIIGKAGVEASAEHYLAGRDGVRPYNVWTTEAEKGVFFPET
ncbi:MAG TPA: hypothetical protein VIL27_08685, partial [Clostridia bacterium]